MGGYIACVVLTHLPMVDDETFPTYEKMLAFLAFFVISIQSFYFWYFGIIAHIVISAMGLIISHINSPHNHSNIDFYTLFQVTIISIALGYYGIVQEAHQYNTFKE